MIETVGQDLVIGGVTATELVDAWSEPLYVYDAGMIEDRCRRLRALLPDNVRILYSLKANPSLSLVAFLREFVDGADVSSVREMYTAAQAGFSEDRMFFVGPSKSREDLAEAVHSRIGCLVVESEEELHLADGIARAARIRLRAALRVNPAFDAAGPRLKMGGASRQFGIDEEELDGVIARARDLEWAPIAGMHAYVGTRILDWAVAVRNTREILDLARRVQERSGVQLDIVDVGGGLGVPYFPGEGEFDLDAFCAEAAELFEKYSADFPKSGIVLELGRFLTAEAGVYITRVRYVKHSRGQKYVLVGGGINHHQATTAVGSMVKHHFPVEVLNKMNSPKDEPAFVCGPLCTPGDTLARGVALPRVEPGDLIGIMKSGAYGLTASPLAFLSHEWPKEVLVYQGRHHLIRQSAGVSDILRDQFLVSVRGAEAAATGRSAHALV
jgi:diaminopimelate decarboxylase